MNKAAGPLGITAETLKVSGEVGIDLSHKYNNFNYVACRGEVLAHYLLIWILEGYL